MRNSLARVTTNYRPPAFAPSPRAIQERDQADRIRAAYRARHGLREFTNGYRNLMMVLKQSGAPKAECERVAARLTRCPLGHGALIQGVFDHGEILGRDGKPTRLMGYPYQISPEGFADLQAIHSLGLTVLLHRQSSYGWGTYQVEVFFVPDPLPSPPGV